MKLKILMLAMMFALATLAHGATNDLTGLLQKGLFEEEANRDLTAAIANYQSLANAFDKDRQLAATAIFRLGECYRKLDKTNEASAEYQRIIKEFSDQQTLVTLSRQNLTGLGGATAPTVAASNPILSEQLRQLEWIKKLQAMPLSEVRQVAPTVLTDATLINLIYQYNQTELDLIRLRTDHGEDHPEVKKETVIQSALQDKIKERLDGMSRALSLETAGSGTTASGANENGESQTLLRLQIERAQEQLVDSEKQERELLKTFTPDNPRVVELKKKMEAEITSLATLAGKLQASQSAAAESVNPVTTDEEQQEIRRIQLMIQNSPDLINAPGGEGLRYTPLIQAAEKGQLVVAKYLLDHGADVNVMSRNGFYTPLSVAAQNGHKAMVELLLSRGAEVNGKGGLNPLLEAVKRGYEGVAEVLLEHKADVNTYSMTKPIHVAVQNGKTDLLQLLIQHGAEVNVTNEEGRTPLEFAAMQNDTNAARLLLAAKASVESRDKEGDTPLHRAAEHGRTAMVSLLIASGAIVDSTNIDDTAPLWLAVWNRNPAATRALLEHKADPNRLGVYPNSAQAGSRKFPPVAAAIWHGNKDTLKFLLDAGADPEGGSWASPLFEAINQNSADCVQLLLDHGANPNRVVNGFPPVNYTLKSSRDPKIISLLLDKGASANATDAEGWTPLLRTTDPEVGRWLVEHQADVNKAGPNGIVPLKNAVNNTNDLKFLLEAGAKPDLQDTNGNTALHDAVYFSATEAVALLLAHKADPNVQNNLGYTPLDLAKVGVEGHSFSNMLSPGMSGQGQISTEVMRKISQLLTDAGGLANLPKRNRIEVRRGSSGGVAFTKGSHDWNRYSLLEIIAGEYGLLSQSPAGEWRTRKEIKRDLFSTGFRFPDFQKIVIYRRTDASAKQTAIDVNAQDLVKSNDCALDVWLQWGDIVEIPETDHPVEEEWPGLSDAEVNSIIKCLARQVTINVKGESTMLKLAPEWAGDQTPINGVIYSERRKLVQASFMLRSVLDNSKLVRVSSDLSRVKVTRVDPETKKKQEWTIDCTNPSQADLWLRDGDVIDVPEK